MNRQWMAGSFALAAAVAGVVVWVGGMWAQERPRVPYTLRREIRNLKPDGSEDTTFRTTIFEARRADGSLSQYIDTQMENKPRQAGARQTWDHRTGLFLHVDYEAKIIEKRPLNAQGTVFRKRVPARCEDVRARPCKAGPVLLGYPTMITELEIPGSGVRSVSYVAQGLDWTELRLENYSVPEGKLQSGQEVTEVVRGEPDAAWFAEPDGFALMKDGVEFLDRSLEGRGIPPWTMSGVRERLKAREH